MIIIVIISLSFCYHCYHFVIIVIILLSFCYHFVIIVIIVILMDRREVTYLNANSLLYNSFDLVTAVETTCRSSISKTRGERRHD